jgi:hypothetical protein
MDKYYKGLQVSVNQPVNGRRGKHPLDWLKTASRWTRSPGANVATELRVLVLMPSCLVAYTYGTKGPVKVSVKTCAASFGRD